MSGCSTRRPSPRAPVPSGAVLSLSGPGLGPFSFFPSRGRSGPCSPYPAFSADRYQGNQVKHEFFVDMTCEGCSNAVTRVLNKLGGVEFEIDLPNKKVCIDSEHNVDTLLETLKKTGKTVTYIGPK
ncbi:PREDICTED: copper transport protein ATOX1 [Myotis davidii]|uniref:copper transport protein ATOX1 n=1 Tax=Myotis davidii TaxID=225400 RepID=UPI000766EEBE|nr:PREDICTED: copper transport protein ATOX1 [Myotis davidii]